MEGFEFGLCKFVAKFLISMLVVITAEEIEYTTSNQDTYDELETTLDATDAIITLEKEQVMSTTQDFRNNLDDDHDKTTITNLQEETVQRHGYVTDTSAQTEAFDDTDLLLIPPDGGKHDAEYSTEKITFRKCCAKNEHFAPHFTCVEATSQYSLLASGDEVGKKYPWFPTHILVNNEAEIVSPDYLEVTRVQPKYSIEPVCNESERLILQWNRDDPAFFFIFVANGSILEMDHRNLQVVAVWPPDGYCLEIVETSYSYHVAILCPCLHVTCVRKCPRGYFYNVTFNICTQFEGPVEKENIYVPSFFEGKKPIDEVEHYLLRSMPPCAGRKIEMLESGIDQKHSQFYIQRNGSLLMHVHKWIIIDNSKYCADIFIDNFGKRTTNVLYCMRDIDRYRELQSYRTDKLFRAQGSFLTINAFLFITALVFIIIGE